METEEDYPILKKEKIRAARAYALEKLGDAAWADNILWAYENPRETIDYLKRNRASENKRI
jgi:uncharacterized protein (DUF427 family)